MNGLVGLAKLKEWSEQDGISIIVAPQFNFVAEGSGKKEELLVA